MSHFPLVLVSAPDDGLSARLRPEATRRGLRLETTVHAQEVPGIVARENPAALVVHADHLDALGALSRNGLAVIALGGDRDAAARSRADAVVDRDLSPAELLEQVALAIERRRVVPGRVLVAATRPLLAGEGAELADPGALWEHLERVDPALLVLDDATPELVRSIRVEPRWAVLPLIAIGGDARALLAAGADDVLADAGGLRERVAARLERHRAQQALADTDPLTGVRTRRTSSTALSGLLGLAERLDQPLCVGTIALETSGRSGDIALRRLGAVLRRGLRGEDVIGRWGECELVVGMLGVERDEAVTRLLELLRTRRTEVDGAAFSAGVAQYPGDATDLEGLHRAAEQARQAGRGAGPGEVIPAGGAHHAAQSVDVAIVEDEESIAELWTIALGAEGYRCWRFSNGAGAVAMLSGPQPHVRTRVILLDLGLPAVGGVELLTLLERDGILRSTQVIVVSGNDDPAMVEHVRELGAADYLVKPVELGELVDKVARAVGRERSGA